MSEKRDAAQKFRSDAELLAELRAGNQSALEDMYALHGRDVLAFACSYLPMDTAKDVVQDIFIYTWQRRESLNVTNGIRAYLFGAVKRKVRDMKRHEEVEKKLIAGSAGGYSPAMGGAGDSPAAAAELSDLHQAVDEVLATLSEEHRTLLTLRWHYGMTYDQAAQVLGISPNAAKKQGQRLEARLRPLFEKFR